MKLQSRYQSENLGLEDPLLSSLTWRLVRGLKSLPCGPFHRVPELLASLTMKDPREQPCRKLQCLLWPDLRSVTNGIQPSLLLYSIGHTKQSWYSVRGHYTRAWTLVWRSLRAIFWGWLPKQLRNLLKVPELGLGNVTLELVRLNPNHSVSL